MSGAYDIWKKAALGSGTFIDLDTDTIKVRLVNITTDYVIGTGLGTATTMSGITGYAGTTDQTLTVAQIVVTVAGSVVAFDATTDPLFPSISVSAGKTIGGLVFYKYTGASDSNNIPILYVDNFTAITPNGGDITLQLDNSSNRILSLT